MSRPYLSAKFRKETGETLTDFVMKEKTEEAKRFLWYSDKSFIVIGAYLGFLSPGHFSRVFKNTLDARRPNIGKSMPRDRNADSAFVWKEVYWGSKIITLDPRVVFHKG